MVSPRSGPFGPKTVLDTRAVLIFETVPKYVFFVQDYPKTPSGKIQKFKLRESGIKWLQEGRGL